MNIEDIIIHNSSTVLGTGKATIVFAVLFAKKI